jgi:hypothetical protein
MSKSDRDQAAFDVSKQIMADKVCPIVGKVSGWAAEVGAGVVTGGQSTAADAATGFVAKKSVSYLTTEYCKAVVKEQDIKYYK